MKVFLGSLAAVCALKVFRLSVQSDLGMWEFNGLFAGKMV